MPEKELTAQQILKAIQEKIAARKHKPVDSVEILGIKGYLFKSSSADMEEWRDLSNDTDLLKSRLGPAKLVQISFRDKDGNRVFDDLNLPLIGAIDDDQIRPVHLRCLQINGLMPEGTEAILKNLIAILGIDGLFDLLANIGAACPNCSKHTANMSSESSTSAKISGLQGPPRPTSEQS